MGVPPEASMVVAASVAFTEALMGEAMEEAVVEAIGRLTE